MKYEVIYLELFRILVRKLKQLSRREILENIKNKILTIFSSSCCSPEFPGASHDIWPSPGHVQWIETFCSENIRDVYMSTEMLSE